MGIRFRKSIKLAPGIKLNISKSGISTSIGKKGASVNVGSKGVYGNVGIPGTGVSFREKIVGSGSKKSSSSNGQQAFPIGFTVFFIACAFIGNKILGFSFLGSLGFSVCGSLAYPFIFK